jgi:hypothetical protein
MKTLLTTITALLFSFINATSLRADSLPERSFVERLPMSGSELGLFLTSGSFLAAAALSAAFVLGRRWPRK